MASAQPDPAPDGPPASRRIAEPGIRALLLAIPAFVLVVPPLVAMQWLGEPWLGALLVACASLGAWLTVRALRVAVVDSGSHLVVRSLWSVDTIEWSAVRRFADGVVRLNEKPSWVLRIDLVSGGSVLARATAWKADGRPATVEAARAMAYRHGVPAELTGIAGAPAAPIDGATVPPEPGLNQDPADESRQRLFVEGAWSPFVFDRPATRRRERQRRALAGQVWAPLPSFAASEDEARAGARALRRSALAWTVVTYVMCLVTVMLYVHVDTSAHPNFTISAVAGVATLWVATRILGPLDPARYYQQLADGIADAATGRDSVGGRWSVPRQRLRWLRVTGAVVIVIAASSAVISVLEPADERANQIDGIGTVNSEQCDAHNICSLDISFTTPAGDEWELEYADVPWSDVVRGNDGQDIALVFASADDMEPFPADENPVEVSLLPAVLGLAIAFPLIGLLVRKPAARPEVDTEGG